jgi:hypothetical protein
VPLSGLKSDDPAVRKDRPVLLAEEAGCAAEPIRTWWPTE